MMHSLLDAIPVVVMAIAFTIVVRDEIKFNRWLCERMDYWYESYRSVLAATVRAERESNATKPTKKRAR